MLRAYTMRVSAALEPRDMWIGVYWTRVYGVLDWMHSEGAQYHNALCIYICVLPCLPIELIFVKHYSVVR